MPHADPEERRAYQREYQREWNKRNPEKRAAIAAAAEAKRARTEQRRASNREFSRKRARARRLRVLDLYGGRCVLCGEAEPMFLQIDHVGGGGKAHREEIRGQYENIYDFLDRNPPDRRRFRILCANCHQAITYYAGAEEKLSR